MAEPRDPRIPALRRCAACAILLLGCGAPFESGADGAARAPAGPAWAADPAVPGENIPAAGRSLFDYLMVRDEGGRKVHDIPFPFAALARKIERELEPDRSGAPALKAVLIPLGRSLQRGSGAPDYYAYPRVVIAPDAEARAAPGHAVMLLKDRVYLGYHEKAALIEVISYNEAAGRFEFQVVKDYRAGGRPAVYYANRAICTACHQNAAPIFSRQVWDETNGNPEVAARLARKRKAFYGVDPHRGVDLPYAIDNATDRANLYSTYQLLWREGCAPREADPVNDKAARCRAGLLTAALQFRLSGGQQYDRASRLAVATAGAIAQAARERWSAGLAIPNPDLPNRNPLVQVGGAPNGDAAHVGAAFDPLAPRAPLETWSAASPATLDRLVAGLSAFFAEADVRRLDAHLKSGRSGRAPARSAHGAACAIGRSAGSERGVRMDFACTASGDDGVALRGRFYLRGARVTEGVLDSIGFGAGGAVRDIDIAQGRLMQRGRERTAELRLARDGMAARRGDGNAIAGVRFTWTEDKTGQPAGGAARVAVVHDFAAVEAAIEALLDDAARGASDALSSRPFRRVGTLRPLFERLRMPPASWCCEDDAGMPPAVMEAHDAKPEAQPVALQPFFRYCATCHQSADRSPPNFLQGSAAAVATNLAHCAQRLYVRLSMWQQPAERRAKTPMPPQYALQGMHLTTEAWRDGAELAALRAHVERLLAAENPKVAPAELMSRGYEHLRECLP